MKVSDILSLCFSDLMLSQTYETNTTVDSYQSHVNLVNTEAARLLPASKTTTQTSVSYCSGVRAAFLNHAPATPLCLLWRTKTPTSACGRLRCFWQSPGQHHALLLDSDQTGSSKESGLPNKTEDCQFVQQLTVYACQATKRNPNTCCHSSPHHSIWCLQCFEEERRVLNVGNKLWKYSSWFTYGMLVLIRYLSAQCTAFANLPTVALQVISCMSS